MDSGWAALLGALIGGAMTWLSSISIEWRRDARLARRLAVGAASEIEAALTLMRARKWRDGVADFEAEAKAGRVGQLSVHAADEYLTLTRDALRESGALDQRLTVMLARLVMLEKSMLSDLKRLAQYPVDHPDSLLESQSPEAAAAFYAELGLLMDAAAEVGTLVVQRVMVLYPENHYGWTENLRKRWAAIKRG